MNSWQVFFFLPLSWILQLPYGLIEIPKGGEEEGK